MIHPRDCEEPRPVGDVAGRRIIEPPRTPPPLGRLRPFAMCQRGGKPPSARRAGAIRGALHDDIPAARTVASRGAHREARKPVGPNTFLRRTRAKGAIVERVPPVLRSWPGNCKTGTMIPFAKAK